MAEILHIPLDDVRPFAGQPRVEFDPAKLRELADSIGEVGQIVSALVRTLPPGLSHKYELVDGERRWRACRLAGVKTLKAEVAETVTSAEQFRTAVAANFGRADHTPLEIAAAIRTIREAGSTLEQTARLFGKSVPWVQSYERLLNLSADVVRMLTHADPAKRLRVSHAQLIAELPKSEQLAIAKNCVKKMISIYEVARAVRSRKKDLGLAVIRKRSPHEDWRVLAGFPGRVQRDLAPLMELGDEELRKLFSTRGEAVLQAFCERLESVVGDLSIFAENLGTLARQTIQRNQRDRRRA